MDNEQLRHLVEQLEQNHAQLQAVTQQYTELEQFTQAFPQATPGAPILATLGKGVFMEATLGQNPSCFVEVGAGIVLKKTSTEVKATLTEQIAHLRTAKTNLLHHQAELEHQAQKLLQA